MIIHYRLDRSKIVISCQLSKFLCIIKIETFSLLLSFAACTLPKHSYTLIHLRFSFHYFVIIFGKKSKLFRESKKDYFHLHIFCSYESVSSVKIKESKFRIRISIRKNCICIQNVDEKKNQLRKIINKIDKWKNQKRQKIYEWKMYYFAWKKMQRENHSLVALTLFIFIRHKMFRK